MLVNTPFYHSTIRRVVTAFGTLFNNIQIERHDAANGNVVQTIKVPVSYGPKEKWYIRLAQDPNAGNISQNDGKSTQTPIQSVIPRIAFELVALNYDLRRKGVSVVKDVQIMPPIAYTGPTGAGVTGPTGPTYDNTRLLRSFKPVPIQLQFQLYVITKTLSDSLQIIEQIVPWFVPDFTISVSINDEIDLSYDIPIVLRYPIVPQDNYTGDFNERRDITWTLVFTADATLYGPVKAQKIVLDSTTRFLASDWPDTDVPHDEVSVEPYPPDVMPDDPFTFEVTREFVP